MHGIIVCSSNLCQCGLSVDQLSYHLNRYHQVTSDDVMEIVNDVKEFLKDINVVNFQNVTSPILPLPHLQIYDGYRCPFCPTAKYFLNAQSFRYHLTHTHSEKGYLINQAKCKVQKLNKREKGSIVFPVTPNDSIMKTTDVNYDSVMGDIDLNFRCGKISKVLEALGWMKFFGNKEWKTERKVIIDEQSKNESLSNATRTWFSTTYSMLVAEAPKRYNLMLHLGYEK